MSKANTIAHQSLV